MCKLITQKEIIDEKGHIDLSLVINEILTKFDIKVAHDKIFVWIPELGCYQHPPNERRAIYKLFDPACINVFSSHQIDEILKRLKSLPTTEFDADSFDNDPTVINCKNGVIDLKTLKILPMDKKYRFSNVLDFEFIPNAKIEDAPCFKAYTETSLNGDKGKIKLLLQITGYSISNDFSLKVACFFAGAPDSGKSNILILICSVYGQENITNLTLSELSKRFSAAQLSLTHLNVNGDIETDTLNDITHFKQITGGDRIFAEFKGQDGFMFNPRVHLLYGCNNLPDLKEVQFSKAYINRVVALNFPISIPKEQQDPMLSKKLWAERNVIFSLAVKEFSELICGNRQFTLDDDSARILQDYKDSLNPVNAFIREQCTLTSESRIHKQTFYKHFKVWCKENGHNCNLTQQDVSRLVTKNPSITVSKFRIDGGSPLAGFKGIKLKDEE